MEHHQKRRRRSGHAPDISRILFAVVVAAILSTVGLGPAIDAAAVQTQEGSTPTVSSSPAGDATPAPETGSGKKPTLARGFGGTGVTPAEQELADKYAPVAMLKKQTKPCDPSGEQYVPIAVDVSLNDPDVVLRRDRQPGESEDPVLITGPSAQDLVNSDPSYYLDLPGNSLDPGCTYEKWSNARIAELGLVPSTYARVVREEGRPGKLALQYFFYWVYNDFLDDHESDWEMVQLIFDANTPEEALKQDPVLITFAQHERGENATWEEGKAQFDGTHLVTYPAAGSHADYFSDEVWLGWGEHGAGFGCDRSNPDSVPTPLKAIVVPTEIEPTGPFAWALFQGRWGEHQSWVLDGPKSPNVTDRWTRPISWTDGLRAKSLPIPHHRVAGLGPSSFFCSVSNLGGDVLKIFPDHPHVVATGTIVVLIALLLVSLQTWRLLIRAVNLLVRNARAFVLSCVLVLPVAALASFVQDQLTRWTLASDLLSDVSQSHSSIAFGIGFVFHVFLLALIAPGVIVSTRKLVAGEPVSALSGVKESLPTSSSIIAATILNAIILAVLCLTVIGIPLAFYLATQWVYAPQAILIDGASWWRAQMASRDVIKGDWPRTVAMALLITYVAGIPGPILGIVLVLIGVSIPVAGIISSVTFAVMYPITLIAATLYYLERREAKRIGALAPKEPERAPVQPAPLSPSLPTA